VSADEAGGRRTWLWFAAIFLVAFAARAVHLSQIQTSPLTRAPILDEKVHHEWAAQFAAGEPWSVDRRTGEPEPYFRAPLYIWFVGTTYKLFGSDPAVTPRLIQALVGSLGCGLLFLLGRRLFSNTVGAIAGFAMALDWVLVLFDGELLIVPLIVFLDVALVLLLVRAQDRPTALRWAAAGVVLGLSAIARPNVLLFAPPALGWVLWVERGRGRSWPVALGRGAVFTAGVLALVLPVTARNWIVGGERVLVASQGGVNFYIGNNPLSDGVTAVVPGTSPDWWEGYDQTHAMVAQDLGREPRESEVSQWFFDRAFAYWSDEPGAALDNLLRKARYLVNRQEWANNKCLYTFVDEFAPATGRLPVGFGLVGPLGLLGLALGMRRAGRLFPLWGFCLAYGTSVVLFFVNARFRAPLVPFLILYGASAAVWLVQRARARDTRPLLLGAGALALLALFVNWIPDRGLTTPHRVREDFFGTLANELADRGDTDRALYWLDRTARSAAERLETETDLRPEYRQYLTVILYSSLYRAGNLLESEGRAEQAANAYRGVLNYLPPNTPQRVDLHERLARLLDGLGRANQAQQHREQAARLRRALGGG
jgi:4-amino-4-deoxy-L-arabinose transferase-like glycosyltransferase